jgi:DNA-binding transcriptional LysR family regulator
MQLRHFRYFVTVAEEGGFLKAARRLHVAQPALSKQIQDLEREIGCPLFERLPRGVRLTAAGHAFLVEARNTLENAARAVATARRAEQHLESRLHFAHGPMNVHTGVLADLLAAFRSAHPQTEVQLHRLNQAAQQAGLREHRIDIAAAYASELPIPDFCAQPILDCSITGVLLPASHPLASRRQVSLPELRTLTWLHAPRQISPDAYRILKSALGRRGLVPSQCRPTDPASAGLKVSTGSAWLLANADLARSFIESNDAIVYRPFVEPPIPYWLVLIWRADCTSALVRGLVEIAHRFSAQKEVGNWNGNTRVAVV